MKNFLSEKTAAYGILLILSCMILFHLLVMAGVIPYEIVWGGRLQNSSEMLRFEAISILSLLAMLFVAAVKAGLIRIPTKPVLLKVALWVMAVLFLLNTLGNLQAVTDTEKWLFTPLTFLLFLLCLRLAIGTTKK